MTDESSAIALNYTSGTTGNPKGVVYHHRGTFLEAVGNTMAWPLPPKPVYLWTLPMFHCNGWCFPWSVTAMGGTHVCLRRVDPALIFPMIVEHGVTHMCGAPTVLNMLVSAPAEQRRTLQPHRRHPDRRLAAARQGDQGDGGARLPRDAHLRHDRVAGPVDALRAAGRLGAICRSRSAPCSTRGRACAIRWSKGRWWPTRRPSRRCARDGEAIGEIMVRGNTVMLGYLKDPKATAEAFRGGWMHTGDLAVEHPDGYVEIKDRAKDIIISGGENISSVEVEIALYRHPAVQLAAVVAQPGREMGRDAVRLRPAQAGRETRRADEIIAFCREQLAHFKAPKSVVFGALPTTATGKIQKFVLREQARDDARSGRA